MYCKGNNNEIAKIKTSPNFSAIIYIYGSLYTSIKLCADLSTHFCLLYRLLGGVLICQWHNMTWLWNNLWLCFRGVWMLSRSRSVVQARPVTSFGRLTLSQLLSGYHQLFITWQHAVRLFWMPDVQLHQWWHTGIGTLLYSTMFCCHSIHV